MNGLKRVLMCLCVVGVTGVCDAEMIMGVTATACSYVVEADGTAADPQDVVNGNGMAESGGVAYQTSNWSKMWVTSGSDTPGTEWIKVDLGAVYSVGIIEIWNYFYADSVAHYERGINRTDIEYSIDGTNWTLAVDDMPVDYARPEYRDEAWVVKNHTDYTLNKTARYIRFSNLGSDYGLKNNSLAIGELRFYGKAAALPLVGSYYYVAPAATGGDGSFGKPFGTLQQARDAVRTEKRDVVLRGGIYELDKPFVLESVDSGKADRPIIYQSYPGETARLMGGKRLAPPVFKPVSHDALVWNRLDIDARGHILMADLAAVGITDYGILLSRGVLDSNKGALALCFEGQTMTLARWPDSPPEDSPGNYKDNWSLSGFDLIDEALSETQIKTAANRLSRWTQATDIWSHGFFRWGWADYNIPVSGIDPATGTITLAQSPDYGIIKGQHYFIYNLMEEITEPGEWYLDRSTGILYFWPPADMSSADIYVTMLEDTLIKMKNTSWVTFKDIMIEGSRDMLVDVAGGSHNVFTGCTLRNAGTHAASVNGTDNGFEFCQVYNTGNGGIQVGGGDRKKLIPANNYVRNSKIHHFGQWVYGYKPGIKLSGVGNVVSHNELYNGPHTAIQWLGNENLMEYNVIYNVCRFANDMGAFYSGRNWSYRGNIIRYNFIHDIYSWSHNKSHGTSGVYMDDCVSGTKVFGNIFYNIAGYGILHGGGRDIIMENNICVNCRMAASHVDNRGPKFINHDPDSTWNLIEKIQKDGIGYQSGIWASTYPKLAAIPPDHEINDPNIHWLQPEGCTYSRNYAWDSGGDEYGIYERNVCGQGYEHIIKDYFTEFVDNAFGQDPLFVDRAKLDMRLQPNSPVYKIPGWKEIPFLEMGVSKEGDSRKD